MKIALINSFSEYSTGLMTSYLCNGIKQSGNDAMAFFGRGNKSNDNWIYIGSSTLKTKFNNLLVFLTGKVGHYHKKNTQRLIEQLKEYNPDIIHIHNIHNNYLNYEMLFDYLKTFKGQIIYTLHDQFLFTGHCGSIPLECKNYKNGCDKCEFKGIYQKVLVDKSKTLLEEKKEFFKGLTNITFVSPSKWLDSFLQTTYLSKYPHLVINNGISLDIRVDKKTKSDKIRLLAVSSYWYKTKGIEFLNQIADRLSEETYEFTVIGKPIEKGYKFSNKIKHINELSREDVFKYMQQSDILINPTLADIFPTVLIESLANGLPAITFDTGGCSEIINNSCGVVVKERTTDSLVEAIKNFDFSKYSQDKIIAESKKFTYENMVQNYLNLYIKVLR